MKIILVVQALTLVLLWACTLVLYASTGELEIAHIFAGVAISISSLGTGFYIYDIIKQWKADSNESRKTQEHTSP